MDNNEYLKIFWLMGYQGAESREEAYGMLYGAERPVDLKTDGAEVAEACKKTLQGYGDFINRYGQAVGVEEGNLATIWRSLTKNTEKEKKCLRYQKTIRLPKAQGGLYPAELMIETNAKEVAHSDRPKYKNGENLFVTICSREFLNEDDNFKIEIVIYEKGGQIYVAYGSGEDMDVGDYRTLDILLEDIDR